MYERHANYSVHCTRVGCSAHPVVGWHVNLHTPCSCMACNSRQQAPRSIGGVARKESFTALRTHGFRSVSQGASPAISACGRRKGHSIAWLIGYQPVACNEPPTLSALSSGARASHPGDKRRRPLGRQVDDDVFYLLLQKPKIGAKLHIYL